MSEKFLSICDVRVFLTFTFFSSSTSGDSWLLMEMIHDRCSTLLTEFSTALTTILPSLFQYCHKCCYSEPLNRNEAGGLAP